MVAFGHTAVGALIGVGAYQIFGNNLTIGLSAAITAGITSHYIADCIPHGHFFKSEEYKSKVKYAIIFDLLLSVFIFLAASYLPNLNITKLVYTVFGIGASQLPDVVDGLMYTDRLPIKGFFQKENKFHLSTHWHGSLLMSVLDIWQLSVVLLSLYFVIIVR